MRYKLWVQVEEIDDDRDHYENLEEPICIGDFDDVGEATERLYALGLLFGGLTEAEHKFLHREDFHETVRQLEDGSDYGHCHGPACESGDECQCSCKGCQGGEV